MGAKRVLERGAMLHSRQLVSLYTPKSTSQDSVHVPLVWKMRLSSQNVISLARTYPLTFQTQKTWTKIDKRTLGLRWKKQFTASVSRFTPPGTVFRQVLWRNFFILNNGRTTARPSDVKEVENARKTTLSIPFTSLSFQSLRTQSFETSIFVASFLQDWSDPANIDSVFRSSGVFLVALAVNALQPFDWYFTFMKHSQHLSRLGHFEKLLHSLSTCSCSKCFILAALHMCVEVCHVCLAIQTPFLWGNPPTKKETHKMKNSKHSEQNIKVEITKKVAKFGSSTRLAKKLKKLSKGAETKFARVVFAFVCAWDGAPTT